MYAVAAVHDPSWWLIDYMYSTSGGLSWRSFRHPFMTQEQKDLGIGLPPSYSPAFTLILHSTLKTSSLYQCHLYYILYNLLYLRSTVHLCLRALALSNPMPSNATTPAAAKQDPEYHISFSYRPSATLNPRLGWMWCASTRLPGALLCCFDNAVAIGAERMLPNPRVNKNIPISDVASGGLSSLCVLS